MVEVQIPDGVSISMDNIFVKVKGPKGETEKDLHHPKVILKTEPNRVIIETKKRDKMFANTFASHINNLIKGVTDGYEYVLKICSGHFPMTVTVNNNELSVKNFLGEKVPRKVRIIEGAKVEVKGDKIFVTGVNKEVVGQTAARIEQSTRIVNRDRRIFQDGIFIISKAGKMVIK